MKVVNDRLNAWRGTMHTVVLISILIGYSWYAILSSSETMATNLLVIFALLSVLMALKNGATHCIEYLKIAGSFLAIYTLLSYLSVYVSTEHANINYFNEKIPFIILAFLIPVGYLNISEFNTTIFKKSLTYLIVSMAVFILLLNNKIVHIDNFRFWEHTMHWTSWTQKNYMFWYVLLFFGTISFYDIKQKKDVFIVIGLAVLSFVVIAGGYSKSAMLSYVAGLFVYLILSITNLKKKYLLLLVWLFSLYIILTPLLVLLFDLPASHPRLVRRNANFNTSAALVKENWLFGYGYGSTLTIKLKEFVSIADLPKHYMDFYPGGHPHNISFLFWLEFGVLGAMLLAFYVYKFLIICLEKTYAKRNNAALFAMVVAFLIITSFSWSIWYPQVLLTFSFFGVLLALSMNIEDHLP